MHRAEARRAKADGPGTADRGPGTSHGIPFVAMRTLAVVLLALLICAPGRAQEITRKPGVYAIRNATVAVDATTVIENATVVLRRGFIEAVGVEASVPADAE